MSVVTIPVVAHLAATNRTPQDIEALLSATRRQLPSDTGLELLAIKEDPVPVGALQEAFPNDPRVRSARRQPSGIKLTSLPAFDRQAMNLFFLGEILAMGGRPGGVPYYQVVPYRRQQLALVPDLMEGEEAEILAACLLNLAGLDRPQEAAAPPKPRPAVQLVDDSQLLAGLVEEMKSVPPPPPPPPPEPEVAQAPLEPEIPLEPQAPEARFEPELPEAPFELEPEPAEPEPFEPGPMVCDLDALPPELRPNELEPPLPPWLPKAAPRPAPAPAQPAESPLQLRLPLQVVELGGGLGKDRFQALLTQVNALWKPASIQFELVSFATAQVDRTAFELACPRDPDSQTPQPDCGPLQRAAGYDPGAINLYWAPSLLLRGTVRRSPMTAYQEDRTVLLGQDARLADRWLALGLGMLLGLAPSQVSPQRLTHFPEPGTQLSPDELQLARERAARLLKEPARKPLPEVDRWILRMPVRIHRVLHPQVGTTRSRRELEEAVRAVNAIFAAAGIELDIASWSDTRFTDALLGQVLPASGAPDGTALTRLPEFDSAAHNVFLLKEVRNSVTGVLQAGVPYNTLRVTLVSEAVPEAGTTFCLALTLAMQMAARYAEEAGPDRLMARSQFGGTKLTPEECLSLRLTGIQRHMLHLSPVHSELAPMRIPLRLRMGGRSREFYELCVQFANEVYQPAGLAFELADPGLEVPFGTDVPEVPCGPLSLAFWLGLQLGLPPGQLPGRLMGGQAGVELTAQEIALVRKSAADLGLWVPAGPASEGPVVKAAPSAGHTVLKLSLKVHLVRNERDGVQRPREHFHNCLRWANEVFKHAGLVLEAVAWSDTELSDAVLLDALPGEGKTPAYGALLETSEFDPKLFNVFFVHEVRRVGTQQVHFFHGNASRRLVLVSESTKNVPGPTCTAIAMGSMLGLKWVRGEPDRLMNEPLENGTRLTPEEIQIVRREAINRGLALPQ